MTDPVKVPQRNEGHGKVREILRSTEGKLIILALLMFATLGAYFYILVHFNNRVDLFEVFSTSLGVNLLGGRAPGIAVIAYFQLPLWMNVAYTMYIEIMIVAFKYSIIVLSIKHYIRFKWLDRVVLHIEEKVHKNETKVKKYGWPGLVVFSLLPLPFTGPVLGSVMGYFLRFSLLRNFASVMLGTLISVVLYSYFFEFFRVYLGMIQVIIVFVLIILLVFYRNAMMNFFRYLRKVVQGKMH